MNAASSSPYAQGLERSAANYLPLTPLRSLARTAEVYRSASRSCMGTCGDIALQRRTIG